MQNFLLSTAIPALAAFFVGHLHLIMPPKKPVDPATPQPAPQPIPLNPAPLLTPNLNSLRPIGQGGLIDIAGVFLASILASSASQQSKLAASGKIVEASQLVTDAPK
jgi:hypothetical protein